MCIKCFVCTSRSENTLAVPRTAGTWQHALCVEIYSMQAALGNCHVVRGLPRRACALPVRSPTAHGRRRRVVRVAASAQTAAASAEELLAWARANGVSLDRVASERSLQSDAPVLVASKDASAGDTLLSVPESLWLSPTAVRAAPIGKYLDGLEPWLQLALALLAEKASPGSGGAAAAACLSCLPASLGSPLFWGEEELQLLQGTQLLQNLLSYK